MSSSFIVTGANPVTEDFTRVGGFIAGCGEAALLVILHGAKGTPTDPDTLGQIIRSAAAQHWVSPTGVSSPNGLTQLANSYGVGLSSGNWQTLLPQYAGQRPIIVGIANASAFGGRDSNVQGHYVTVVGRNADGSYVVSDPNASSKFGKFDTYTAAQFAAARPFWAAVPTNWSGSTSVGSSGIGGATAAPLALNPLDPRTWLQAIGQQFSTLFTWLTDPLRILKLVGGVATVGVAILLTVSSVALHTAPTALSVAGTATGQPELAVAGQAIKSRSPNQAARLVRRGARSPGGSAPKNVRPKAPTADRGGATSPKPVKPAKQNKGTPVYYGGKQVGEERDGKVILTEGAS